MSPVQEAYKAMGAHLERLETEAITQALCRALGVDDCNPYDYLNRMSAQYRGDLRYVLLDGRDLIRIHPVETVWGHYEIQCTLRHEYLWAGDKKPTV